MVKKEGDRDNKSIVPGLTLVSDDPTLKIHPLTSQDGVIIKVEPTTSPPNPKISHVPCDIVLVIDVSSSMSCNAPAPTMDSLHQEDFGLSILDLIKHAACTILETLDEGDRLGIVTFSEDAQVLQSLLPMAGGNKESARRKIESMLPQTVTNLWGGITAGLKLFEGNNKTGRVPAVMILTDGQPNHMCPGKGYVPKLRDMFPLPATIHTFGFGYDIRSGLLKSIAEIGGGNYAFIPDAGMIGTVFVHAVAHLQSTYATSCTLELVTPKPIRLRTTVGKTVHREEESSELRNKLTIHLDNLQYGQSRDIYLENVDEKGQRVAFNLPGGVNSDGQKVASKSENVDSKGYKVAVGSCGKGALLRATMSYSFMQAPLYEVSTEKDLLTPSLLPDAEVAYHKSRSIICSMLSSCFTLQKNGEYIAPTGVDPSPFQAALHQLVADIPAKHFGDPRNRSIMEDLVGEGLAGQVSLALSRKEYFNRWGGHYFLSLWNAHAKQLCNSFKDPGPQMYNNHNAFFARCRDTLDRTFDDLPPPKPSYTSTTPTYNGGHYSMATYNKVDSSCFAASSRVLLSDGRKVPICRLRKGAHVQTPLGGRRVVAVLRTPVRRVLMCRVRDLLVTPWHPIKGEDGAWVFPVDVAGKRVRYTAAVYSLLLQEDGDVDAHAVRVGGIWGVTLGHGLVNGGDVRAHTFFGDYAKVLKSLESLGPDRNGVKCCCSVQREEVGGLVRGFRGARII